MFIGDENVISQVVNNLVNIKLCLQLSLLSSPVSTATLFTWSSSNLFLLP